MITEIKPNEREPIGSRLFRVFLAGSIEQGKATRWHSSVVKALDEAKLNVAVYNPRRENWDPTWDQSPENPQFKAQVEWELSRIERSDIVFFYFEPGTISPITLLELGLCLGARRSVIVCCPDGFHRKGNVQVTMSWEGRGHRLHDEFTSAVMALIDSIRVQASGPRIHKK